MDIKPSFLTLKYSIKTLELNIYPYQLRDHFLHNNNLYVTQCNCVNHKHNKEHCNIVDTVTCGKCQKPTKLLLNYQTIMFHNDLIRNKIYTCCKHIHKPPCNKCINCQTNQQCIVHEPFECNITTGKKLKKMKII